MSQGGCANDGVAKVAAHVFVGGPFAQKDLHNDSAMQRQVLGAVHLGGAAHADQFNDAIAPDEGVIG